MRLIKNISVFVLLLLASAPAAFGQNFSGAWEGSVDVGQKLRILFFIENNNGVYSTKLQSPDQSPAKIDCSGTVVDKDSITISVAVIGGSYKGRINGDQITGVLSQSGLTIPLDLKRSLTAAKEPNRPQTPKPPYPYNSEDVVYYNADRSIQYGATITWPKGKGPFPAVLLITGSGLQNRDEELMNHKPFAVMADYLTKRGYAVLRVDDRSMGTSTGDVKNATSEDFAKDVNVSLDYLKARQEVNKKKLGLLGHSEGGMIAEMVAAERKDVDFIILFAAPGVQVADLMVKQVYMTVQTMGIDSATASPYVGFYSNLMHSIVKQTDRSLTKTIIADSINAYINNQPADIVAATTGIVDSNTKNKFINQFAAQVTSPWFQYFIRFDPAPYLHKLHCKVLAIDGSRDIQVDAKMNLQGIREGLKKSKSKSYEVKELQGLNHLFQKCNTCTLAEYAEIEETIDPMALDTIGAWLDKEIK